MVTANLLQAYDDVRAAYQERFRHILVDEFQDTNHAQNEIVKLLGEAHGNVCVVGDSDQSVYRWRGADIRNILEFERAFPNVTTIMLEQNFRSTQTILDAANAVIANNIGRQPKELFTVGDTGGPVKRYRAEDERDEASWVSSEILRLHASEGLTWGDVAVFYRTNAQSLPLETSMKFSGIPYKVVGGAKFYDRREIKDVLAYVRVLANPDDEVSARRIVNVPKRGHRRHLGGPAGRLGPGRARALQRGDRPGRGGRPLGQGAQGRRAAVEDAGRAAAAGADGEPGRLRPAGGRPDRATWPSWWPSTPTRPTAGSRTWPSWPPRPPTSTTSSGFLETVALVADSDELDSDGTRVSLMTLHTAKGLEYPAVFVVGLEEGIFPHFRSLAEPSELEEERRLFYVGITRARQHLAISHAWSRTTWGRTQPAMPSRFVTEVPSHLVDDVGLGSPRRGTGYDTLRARSTCPGPSSRRPCPWAPVPRRPAPAAGRRRRGSTGAEDLGPGAGRRGGARPLGRTASWSAPRARARGPRPRSTSTRSGKKNLLLSATPLRRA